MMTALSLVFLNVFTNYLIAIAILLVCFGVISYLINKGKDSLLFSEFEKLLSEKNISYNKVKNDNYNYIMNINDRNYYVRFMKVPTNSQVTINSKTTWCLQFGGSRKGRSYPNKKYMNELSSFLRMKLPLDTDLKIIVLYPSTERILRYLNESEISEVFPIDTPNGYKVISYDKLALKFNDLLSTRKKKIGE